MLSGSESRIVKITPERLSGRTRAGQILRVKSAERGFDRLADPDNPFFHARAEESDPKLAAIKRLRVAGRRRTAGMRSAVKLHSLNRRRR